MPTVVMAGVSHHTADLADLERFTLTAPRREVLLTRLFADGFTEVAMLSTCSRVEVYAVADHGHLAGESDTERVRRDAERLRRALIDSVGQVTGAAGCVVRCADTAVAHLFRVTAGLDSRLIGESDIQAQVSTAAAGAVASAGEPRHLQRLVAAALATARSVHTRTALGGVGRSLGLRALERGLEVAGPLIDRRVLVLGSGTMARLVVQAVTARALTPVVLARDLQSADRLTCDGAQVRPMDDLGAELARASLAIVATSADHQLLTAAQARQAVHGRASQPLTIVDLAVPRNVDVDVGTVAGVVLLDVSALHDASPDAALQEQIAAAEQVTASAAGRYVKDQRVRAAGHLVRAMREQVGARCRQDLLDVTGDALDRAMLDRATRAVIGPVLHAHTQLLKSAAAVGDAALLGLLTDAYRPRPVDRPPPAALPTQRPKHAAGALATSYRHPSANRLDQSWPC